MRPDAVKREPTADERLAMALRSGDVDAVRAARLALGSTPSQESGE